MKKGCNDPVHEKTSHWRQEHVIYSMQNKIIDIAVKMERAIPKWSRKEGFELRQYGEEIERSWTSRRRTVLKQVVERENRSRIVPYSLFVLSFHRTYFTPLKTESE